jgi:hypothetical protein
MLYSICRFFLHNYPCIYFDSKSHNCQNYCIYWHSWLCLEMALPLYMVNYVSSEILWLSHTLLDPNEFQSEMNAFKNSTDDMREMQTLHGASHALIAIPNNILIPTDSRTRKSHNQTFRHITTQKDTYKWSFFSHTIVQWNILPQTIISSPSIDSFREQLTPAVLLSI